MNALAPHQKRLISLRSWLLGRRFYRAARMLELACTRHVGTRKDGVTPEIDHPVFVTLYLRTLEPHFYYPEPTFITSIAHDLREDYDFTHDMIVEAGGELAATATDRLTKVWLGEKRDEKELFRAMAEDPIASLVKGADRIHNQHTMVGVFSGAKQAEYIDETERLILPMLKRARRTFPRQEAAYENMKLVLASQIAWVGALQRASANPLPDSP